jgi:hypothetical protein
MDPSAFGNGGAFRDLGCVIVIVAFMMLLLGLAIGFGVMLIINTFGG